MAGCALVAGCTGGDDAIPEDASVQDFCDASDAFSKATKFPDGVKAADGLHDTGTPQGVPSDARKGFELVVRIVTESEDQADLEKRYKKLTETQKKLVAQLDDYISETC